MTSDHLPIRGIIPSATFTGNPGPSKIRVPKKNMPNFARDIAKWVHPPSDLSTIEKVDAYAQELCFHLSEVIKATGTRVRKESGKSAPWWTPRCKSAHAEYRASTSLSQRAICAKKLRETITAAKKEHQTCQVEAMTSPADIFKLMRSTNHRQVRPPPPLNYNGPVITDPSERATVLRDALLARHQASDDLPTCTAPSNNRIHWEDDISDNEVRTCTIGCTKTAPGADGVTVELLEACWKTIGPCVTQLFRACIRLGTHPSCFKLAEVVLLEKPNRDPTSIKGWRPIALLSCLGKGLERLLAKRMAHLAITYDVVGHQQFCALPKRCSTDLVIVIVC